MSKSLEKRIEEAIDTSLEDTSTSLGERRKLKRNILKQVRQDRKEEGEEGNTDADRDLTRRKFLKMLGIGTGGLALSSSAAGLFKITDQPQTSTINADTIDGNQASNFATANDLSNHAGVTGAHHTKYTDTDAQNAVDGANININGNADTVDNFDIQKNGSDTNGVINFSTDRERITIDGQTVLGDGNFANVDLSIHSLPNQDQVLDLPTNRNACNELFVPYNDQQILLVGRQGGFLEKYSLSSDFSLSGATLQQTFSTPNTRGPRGLWVRDDGKYMAWNEYDSNKSYEYTLSTPYDLSTMNQIHVEDWPYNDLDGLWFKPDGTKLFMMDRNGQDIHEFILSTPFRISTANKTPNATFSHGMDSGASIYIDGSGTKMICSSYGSDDHLRQFVLSTPYDVSSASRSHITSKFDYPEGFTAATAGDKIMVTDYSREEVERHDLS
ncbi:twin-arginine translocation signal domain-containing protein [Nanohaloarchaea archaeon]|nr:twin-arginine translocation signal domain-containing protein [Candidatus Nanohaloarchaea archaeon]